MKTITVKHEVSPGRESCEFGGDFWGKEVCKYHTFRTQTHGRKAPPEYRKPKCLLFDCWLEQPYKKCEACKKACMEAEYGLMSAADKTKLDGMDTTIDKAIANHTATDAEVSEMLAEIYGE